MTQIPDLLSMDIDAVLLCHTDPKSDAAVDAFEAGKHVLVEKPIAASLQETDRMIEAQQKAGKVGQAAYMKIYDPGFVMAKQEIDEMSGYEFVQINHLHPNNYLHLDQFRVRHFDDVPPEARVEKRKAYEENLREAFGDLTEQVSPWCGNYLWADSRPLQPAHDAGRAHRRSQRGDLAERSGDHLGVRIRQRGPLRHYQG